MIYRGYVVKSNATDSGVFMRIFKDGVRVHALPMDASEEDALKWINEDRKNWYLKALDTY